TEFSHSKPLESFRGWLLEQASAYAAPEGDAGDADQEDDEDVE
ncbi:LysR family transcriptional regulator, partial [Escherichia coli]|nr:LysR family transcriptional regulator [Escherichia coli]